MLSGTQQEGGIYLSLKQEACGQYKDPVHLNWRPLTRNVAMLKYSLNASNYVEKMSCLILYTMTGLVLWRGWNCYGSSQEPNADQGYAESKSFIQKGRVVNQRIRYHAVPNTRQRIVGRSNGSLTVIRIMW